MDKVLYSLGCTCDPHVSWQSKMKQFVAPSIFAGLIQLQEEADFFIPKSLFDGTLEDHFFDLKKWERLERLNLSSCAKSIDGVFRTLGAGEAFSYHFNKQNRIKLDASTIDLSKAISVNDKIYYNPFLHLLNIHAKDKTPGVDPTFVSYQKAKYEFFLKNKRYFKFGIYLHMCVSESQLLQFQSFIVDEQKLDPSNFIVFIRSKDAFSSIEFRKVFLPYSDGEQSNPEYSSQRNSIVDSTKAAFLNK